MATDGKQPLYRCTRCGACCRWPGDVCLEEGEAEAIAEYLQLEMDDFIRDYCGLRQNRQGLTIIEDGQGACIMLEDGGCRINPVKPRQCRDFPNNWNFPGWREVCKAEPIDDPEHEYPDPS